jgi:hypothetical protein
MSPELDIRRPAQVMMKRYGGQAAAQVDERAGALIEKG